MTIDGLVVRDGDLATASGRVIRNQAGDWFEPPVRVGYGERRPGTIRPVAPVAVRIAGADFDELAPRFTDGNGTVEGAATITGTWSAGELRVQRQAAPRPYIHQHFPRWVTPPGPAPAGGWPRGDHLRFDRADLPDASVVTVTVFRPGQDQEVLVVAATDTGAAEAWLRPRFGDRLCVVASRWTTEELEAVRAHLDARHRAWKLVGLGQSTSEDGQACIAARLTLVLPEIASWAASLPTGIVSLDPWLMPAEGLRSDPRARSEAAGTDNGARSRRL